MFNHTCLTLPSPGAPSIKRPFSRDFANFRGSNQPTAVDGLDHAIQCSLPPATSTTTWMAQFLLSNLKAITSPRSITRAAVMSVHICDRFLLLVVARIWPDASCRCNFSSIGRFYAFEIENDKRDHRFPPSYIFPK